MAGPIRNPWLLPSDSPAHHEDETIFDPTGNRMLMAIVLALYEEVMPRPVSAAEISQVQKMKKYMNYLGVGVRACRTIPACKSPRHNRRPSTISSVV